jgi:hypothetical protein
MLEWLPVNLLWAEGNMKKGKGDFLACSFLSQPHNEVALLPVVRNHFPLRLAAINIMG